MGREFGRVVILATEDIKGHFKYKDDFQIIALDDSHPKPNGAVGHFPLVIEYFVEVNEEEEKLLKEDMNVSAHDTLKDRLNVGSFHRAKIDEIKILLTLFTHTVFFEYNNKTQELGWFSSFGSGGVHWGQKFYTPGTIDYRDLEGFSSPDLHDIPLRDSKQYFERKLYSFPGQTTAGESFHLPDIINELFDAYFNFEKEAKKAFLQSSSLFYQCMDIWHKSKSLAYAALISSLETLVHYNHRNEKPDHCDTCGSDQYHVLKKFMSFLDINEKQGDIKYKNYVNMLYGKRSKILHRGHLLLSDLSAPGYYSFHESEEEAILRNLVFIVKRRLIRWLLEKA